MSWELNEIDLLAPHHFLELIERCRVIVRDAEVANAALLLPPPKGLEVRLPVHQLMHLDQIDRIAAAGVPEEEESGGAAEGAGADATVGDATCGGGVAAAGADFAVAHAVERTARTDSGKATFMALLLFRRDAQCASDISVVEAHATRVSDARCASLPQRTPSANGTSGSTSTGTSVIRCSAAFRSAGI